MTSFPDWFARLLVDHYDPGTDAPDAELVHRLDSLPVGQRRVATALINSQEAPTYPSLARQLQIGLGTVHRHLGRVRLRHPTLYADLMAERQRQLLLRHRRAVARAEARSAAWHRSQSARRFYYRFGRWPWEIRHRR